MSPLFAEIITERYLEGLLGTFTCGLIGIVLLLFAFKLFDWILPKLDFEKEFSGEKPNLPLAIVVGSLLLGVAYIIASVVH